MADPRIARAPAGADTPTRANLATEAGVKIDKQELVRVLRTEGDNDTADRVAERLPDDIDTERDGEALSSIGLDDAQLMAKLAGGGYGGAGGAQPPEGGSPFTPPPAPGR